MQDRIVRSGCQTTDSSGPANNTHDTQQHDPRRYVRPDAGLVDVGFDDELVGVFQRDLDERTELATD